MLDIFYQKRVMCFTPQEFLPPAAPRETETLLLLHQYYIDYLVYISQSSKEKKEFMFIQRPQTNQIPNNKN